MLRFSLSHIVLLLYVPFVLRSQSYIAAHDPKRLTQYMLDHWQVKEGLPQNSVNAIVQTRDGYVWLGTYEGLVRFNGNSFTLFDRGNTPELRSNRITSLCEDTRGRLWIGSYGGGVAVFDAGEFRIPVHDTTLGSYVTIASMTADPFGRVWIISEKGVFSLRDSVIDRHYPLARFGTQGPVNIVSDAAGNIWLWTSTKLFVIGSGNITERAPDRPQHMFSPVVPSRESYVWFFDYSPKGINRIGTFGMERTYRDTIPRALVAKGISPLFEDSRGVLWCSLRDGIATYDHGRWDWFDREKGFVHENLQTAVEDREGSIWLGTNGSGLLRFRNCRFTPIGMPEGLSKENVWSIFEDSRRRKWIGFLGGGCYRIDADGITMPAHDRGVNYFNFLEDRERNIWYGGNNIIDVNGKVQPIAADGRFISSTLSMDSSGRVWFASLRGGIRIVQNKRIVDSLFLGSASADNSIRTMMTDRDGSMWIGTQEGLFHLREGALRRYTIADGLPNNWIRFLYQDGEGILWIATDGGLAKRVNDRFLSYTIDDGLHSNTIHAILEDDYGRLWMSSNKGVFVVSKSDLLAFDERRLKRIPRTVYGEEDGMRSAEGNGSYQQGGRKMSDGTLWFATIKGIAVVDPDDLKTNTTPPPVYIERIVSDGKEIDPATPFVLQYPVNDLTFSFAALSFRVPSRVRYKYMLEGFHDDWIDAGNQRRASFTNLPSGDFVFRVIACNDDGVWNTAGTSVSFTLPPPFWGRWWFYAAAGIALIGSLAGIIRYIEMRKIKRRIEQLEREKALERERMRISNDMHDEVGANLTKIAILSELAARNTADMPKHLATITETSREVIDSMSQIIWAINPKNDKLENLAAYLREYISETFDIAGMHCAIAFPDDLPAGSLSAEFRRNIFLTVKEAAHNVLKYSRATEVTVRLAVEEGLLSFVIGDNGKGFDVTNPPRFGNGLHTMKKRIADLGGELSIESAERKGTTVRFSVPMRGPNTTFV